MHTATSVFFSQETKLPPIWLLFSSTGDPVECQERLQKVLVHLGKTFFYCWRPALFCLLYLIRPLQSSNTDLDYPPLPQNPFLSISFTKVKATPYGNESKRGKAGHPYGPSGAGPRGRGSCQSQPQKRLSKLWN